jgi:hypothetical protein
MGFFSRKPQPSVGASAGNPKQAQAETLSHLKEFVASRNGVEAYIEPPTRVTQTTIVLVADTGEWTRRRVPDEATAKKVAASLGVVAFDVNLSGYPSRKREWDAAQRKRGGANGASPAGGESGSW